MSKLYETLNEMLKDDITQKFSPDEIEAISDSITRKVKKKLGGPEYSKLEKYVIKNKNDSDLIDVLGFVSQDVGMESFGLLDFDDAGEIKATTKNERILGYKIITKLYGTLVKSNYDAELAILEIWDKDD